MKTTLLAILVTGAAVIPPSAVWFTRRGRTAVPRTRGSNSPMSRGEKEEAVAEALIRQRVEDLVKAIRAKDIDGITSLYAPNLVSFDITPPLRYVGADNKRRAWQGAFAALTGPIAYEVRDLNVTTHGELAFVHSLNHVSGTLASGHITDRWLRWTACFRRIDGVWLVVHDHVSVPADLEHGQAVLNLTP
jgi:ketosteroid isomerase-like protein